MTNITEIIPDDMPTWAREAMEDGQLWNRVFARIDKLQSCIDKTDKFVNDVMPQIGGICIQDYANLNEMCMLLTELKTNE